MKFKIGDEVMVSDEGDDNVLEHALRTGWVVAVKLQPMGAPRYQVKFCDGGSAFFQGDEIVARRKDA